MVEYSGKSQLKESSHTAPDGSAAVFVELSP